MPMHMKRVMMMRPKLVLKESMSVNQYIPPCDGKTQDKMKAYDNKNCNSMKRIPIEQY